MIFKTLYHEKMAPILPATEQEDAKLKALGYRETYVHQEFPRHIYHPDLGVELNLAFDGKPVVDRRGQAVPGLHCSRIATNAAHEAQIRAELGPDCRYSPANFGKTEEPPVSPAVAAKKAADEKADLLAEIEQLKAALAAKKPKGKGSDD